MLRDVSNRLRGTGGTTAQYPDMGFAVDAAQSALALCGALSRKVGSGAKRSSRASGAVEGARALFGKNSKASFREAGAQLAPPGGAVRRILSDDLDIRPLSQITSQSIKAANAAK